VVGPCGPLSKVEIELLKNSIGDTLKGQCHAIFAPVFYIYFQINFKSQMSRARLLSQRHMLTPLILLTDYL
jgi:hypothetical protein